MEISYLIEHHYGALKKRDFRGYDPYDGLKSAIFAKSPCFRSRAMRLAWIQLFKRSPINLRPVAMVPEGHNAKGLALVIRGLVLMHQLLGGERYLQEALRLADIIISQRAPDRNYLCVGYDFFWEAKAFSVPAFTPNMTVSSFTGQAFLDLHGLDTDGGWLDYARQIGAFIEKELILFESDDEIVFGYIPGEHARVHNVNLMGGSFFARLHHLTGEERYGRYAEKAARYSVRSQRDDGAWAYGENPHHQWVDNFHTGFNLISLNEIDGYLPNASWKRSMEKGLAYHMEHHFLEDMTPKYYDSRLYPIDIHNFAQGIVTLLTFGLGDRARLLLRRCLDMMWDEKRNYFYYQKSRWYTNTIDYMRWSQAWMFYALSRYLMNAHDAGTKDAQEI